ncbi:hypothetical protein B0H14DRAFT_2187646, partial [Mycena olivaceomarginata]
ITWGTMCQRSSEHIPPFQVSTNVPAVVITFMSTAASVQESSVFSAVQLLWINITMDTFAGSSSCDGPCHRIFAQPQADKKTTPPFSTEMYKHIPFQSTSQIIITLVFHFAGLEIL